MLSLYGMLECMLCSIAAERGRYLVCRKAGE